MEQLRLSFVPVDDPLAREWLEKVPEFDPGVLYYPTTRMLCSYRSQPVGFLPIQKVVMLETLGMDPSADLLTAAQAMRDLVKGTTLTASSDQIKEIYFLGTDKHVIEIAQKCGFEVLKWPILRMRL